MAPSRRVAIDLRPLARGAVTGVAFHVLQVLEELSARGWSFCGITDRPIPEDLLRPHIPLHIGKRAGGRLRWEGSVLPTLLRELHPRPDLFHATWNHGVPAGLPFPSLLTLHDLIPWRLPRFVPWPRPALAHRLLYRRAVRHSVRAASLIVTPSEASRRDIAALLPEAAARIAVIPHAVPRWFRPAEPAGVAAWRQRFGGRAYWLYFGGFDPRKGVETLLLAMSHARFPAPGAPALVLAGAANEERARLLALARDLGVSVHAPGYVPDAELPALLAGAGLFLYPSLYEGFGIPPLLALAAGVPCVVSDGGALPELVADAGVVVPAGDVPALAGALERAAADDEWLRSVAARGPARAQSFNLEALADRMTRAYERAAATRGESA